MYDVITEVKVETLEEERQGVTSKVANKFISKSELSEAQLTDPDYRLKAIFGANLNARVCSICHHCRR